MRMLGPSRSPTTEQIKVDERAEYPGRLSVRPSLALMLSAIFLSVLLLDFIRLSAFPRSVSARPRAPPFRSAFVCRSRKQTRRRPGKRSELAKRFMHSSSLPQTRWDHLLSHMARLGWLKEAGHGDSGPGPPHQRRTDDPLMLNAD